ncbi:MAG: sigma-70 family RNA polymerase sigma factor [Pseudomonadota bacterium]
MDKRSLDQDHQLVRECLAGSEDAWKEFYSRFIGLMRVVALKHGNVSNPDVEDITQSAFLSLTTALKSYDFRQSLPRFVTVVTERVLIDEYRKSKAAKRDKDLEVPASSFDYEEDKTDMLQDPSDTQDVVLEQAQLADQVRKALNALDEKCRRLITLRYIEDRSFKEIAESLRSTENTVTVQTRRCLDALRTGPAGLKSKGKKR